MDSSEIIVNNSEGTLSEEEDDLDNDNESTSSNTLKSSPGGSVDSGGKGFSISATSGKVLYFPKPEILPNKVRIFRCPEDGCNKTFS